ncbi:MAG: hypothetical protein AAGB12_16185 [Pseudomonadota bacterium]
MNINTYIDLLKGKLCWSVVAGPGTGSVVKLGFGGKNKRNKPLKNAKLINEQRCFKPELELMIHCAWRLLKSDIVICGWRDSNELEGNMLKGLNQLNNKTVESIRLSKNTYDLDIYFENDICFQLFCDQTNDYDSDENFTLFMNPGTCTIGLKSIIEVDI